MIMLRRIYRLCTCLGCGLCGYFIAKGMWELGILMGILGALASGLLADLSKAQNNSGTRSLSS